MSLPIALTRAINDPMMAAFLGGQRELPTEVLPVCIEVEQALLGAAMVNNEVWSHVSMIVEADHFAENVHKTLWIAIGQMVTTDRVATPITLKPYVGDFELAEGVTPMVYLARLAAEATTVLNARGYAREIRDMAARRLFMQSCYRALIDTMRPNATVSVMELLREHEDRVEAMRPRIGHQKSGFRHMRDVAHETYQGIQDEATGKVKRRTLTTGLAKLDRRFGGLEAPNLIVVAGRPASGKTALAIDMAFAAAQQIADEQADTPDVNAGCVGIFSLEMDGKQITERVLSRMSRIAGTRLKRRDLMDPDLESLSERARELGQLNVFVDETGGLAISALLARARALHRKHRLRLLVIDYLQLVEGFKSRGNDSRRNEELGQITGALKQLAKDLNIPIIVLSQVGRQVDQRENKRPNDSDLRESGAIENDADQIMFIYREEAYVRKEQPLPGTEEFFAWERRLARCEGIAEVIAGKNRGGAQGPEILGFDGPLTTFFNEPLPRQVEPEQVRHSEKREPPLTGKSAALFGLIEAMILHHGQTPTDEQIEKSKSTSTTIPRRARIIERSQVFQEWHNVEETGQPVEAAQKSFNDAMRMLRKRQKTLASGNAIDGVWLWLTETMAG